MLSLTPCFRGQSNSQNGQFGRVLRSTPDYLLVGSTQRDRTSIFLVRPDDSSLLVLSLAQSLDLVNASLSSDNEMIHITEKITNKTGDFIFKSKIIDITRGYFSEEGGGINGGCYSKEPIDGLFISPGYSVYPNNSANNINTGMNAAAGLNTHKSIGNLNKALNSPRNDPIRSLNNIQNYNGFATPGKFNNSHAICNTYNFIFYTGENLSIFKIRTSFSKKAVEMVRIKLITNVIWFTFDSGDLYQIPKGSGTLTYISGSRSSFSLVENKVEMIGITSSYSSKIFINPLSTLPDDFALRPINLRLPIFSPFSHRIYMAKKDDRVYLFEQIYDENRLNCTFTCNSYPNGFKHKIIVPNVNADIPINFLQKENLVFIYAPNNFICIFDITQQIPRITLMPKQFASAICGECTAPLLENDSLIDLDTFEIFRISLSFTYPQVFINSLTSNALFGLATICARLSNVEYMSSIFRIIELKNDYTAAIDFFKDFFSICHSYSMKNSPTRSKSWASQSDQNEIHQKINLKILNKIPTSIQMKLNEFDITFPSSSHLTRTMWFCKQMKSKKINDVNIEKVISYMKQQNNMAVNIRSAIDQWIAKYNPQPIWKMIIGFSIQNETIFCDFPAVPYLKGEMDTLSQKFCSPQMGAMFAKNGILNVRIKPRTFDQLDYWNKRIKDEVCSKPTTPVWKVCTRTLSPRRARSESDNSVNPVDSSIDDST
ncbi:hypothetical protein TRFO_25845 [Tritrichomonas foetus]|uniref:Uncharacterized protein n=1 Tax=Tritrichomonas foetus TaxID=1144522 RepID=A0A1J4K9N8_9EUKA|nr:hypothetical protein TRFO_25845 [Tritrichomonas foetus]|eukprot:OHT06157.1 hypothetical protein TRFO_25845 [Tritrichomonas foetus]